MLLKKDDTVLIFIDVQGRLAELVHESGTLFRNLRRLLEGMRILDVPVIATEQIPEKLGPTREEFQPLLPENVIAKSSFGCCGEPAFMKALEESGRRTVILCGIETHVCVYQTAMGLLDAGYSVHVPIDAVSSRDPAQKELALRRMAAEGVRQTSIEMLLFELLSDACAPQFKQVLGLIKE